MKPRFGMLAVGCAIAAVPISFLSLRLVWEQTFLSWERGPQMVGFSLMHAGIGIVLILTLCAGLLWAVITLVVAAVPGKQRHATNFAAAFAVIVLALPTFVPYGFWIRLFAPRIAATPYGPDFLVHMAAFGDISAVDALLEAGVPINSSNQSGIRAIEASANEKQSAMRDHLAIRGGSDKRF